MSTNKMTLLSQLIPMTLAVMLCLIDVVTLAEAQAKAVEKPFNRVVLMIDASGSYRDRQASAIAKADAMLAELAGRRVKRWESGDEVIIISLDAIPEVIWQGPIPNLKGINETAWKDRFDARSDYAGCTDVGAGFRLAARLLGKDPLPTEKYLLVFSDLKDEPPTTSPSICQPPKRPSPPALDFPWDQLADVSTSVFWMPPAQKLAWKRAVDAEGVESFQLYTTSESGVVELIAPDAAKKIMSEAERERYQDNFWNISSYVVSLLLYAAGIGLVIIIIVMIVLRFSQGRSLRRRRPPRNSRQPLPGNRRPSRRPPSPANQGRR